MKIERTKFDTILTRITQAVMILTLIFYGVYWFKTPDTIPMHYNLQGQIDRWGSKYESLIIPAGMIILYVLMAFLEKKPSLWNTGVTITPENKQRVYQTLLHFTTTTRFIVIVFFSYLTICTLLAVPLGKWVLLGWLVTLAADFIFWFYLLFKVR